MRKVFTSPHCPSYQIHIQPMQYERLTNQCPIQKISTFCQSVLNDWLCANSFFVLYFIVFSLFVFLQFGWYIASYLLTQCAAYLAIIFFVLTLGNHNVMSSRSMIKKWIDTLQNLRDSCTSYTDILCIASVKQVSYKSIV